MAGLNRVTLIGNLGKDPEQKSFSNGGSIVNFSIATSEKWKDRQSGEQKEKTEWHNISVTAEGAQKVVMQYVKKGDTIGIVGKLQTRKWADQNGNDRYTTEIVVGPFSGEVILIGGGNRGSGSQRGGTAPAGDAWGGGGQSAFGGSPGRNAFADDLEDEIPFFSAEPADDPMFRRRRVL